MKNVAFHENPVVMRERKGYFAITKNSFVHYDNKVTSKTGILTFSTLDKIPVTREKFDALFVSTKILDL
jgi:hypothetical protein